MILEIKSVKADMETIEKAEQHKSKSKATAIKGKESKQKRINI